MWMRPSSSPVLTLEERLERLSDAVSAAESGDIEAVESIINRSNQTLLSMDAAVAAVSLPGMVRAFLNGHADCVLSLVGQNYSNAKRSDVGPALLSLAAVCRCLDSVEQLVKHGVEVNSVWQNGTPLVMALKGGSIKCIRFLLKAGADPNAGIYGFPIAQAKTIECAELLLEHGAKVNGFDSVGFTPLGVAAAYGSYALAKFLIDHGANANPKAPVPAEAFWPPLVLASANKDVRVIELLLSNGADLHATNFRMLTPLIYACVKKTVDCVRFLLNRGADVRAKDNRGMTALHYVSEGWSKQSFEESTVLLGLLVEHGANPDAQDTRGRTPLSLAITRQSSSMIRTLLQHGAIDTGKQNLSARRIVRKARKAGEKKDKLGEVFLQHIIALRMRRFRGIVRFLIISRRYREAFYRDTYVTIGAQSFMRGKRKLRETDTPGRRS